MDSIFGPSESSNLPTAFKAKVILLGDHAVGKSAIVTRYIKNYFEETKHATVGIDFLSKNIKVNQAVVRLQMWDTAGQQRFRSLIPGYLKDCLAALIVFDLSNPTSFDNTTNWISLVRDVRGTRTRMFLIGNKADLKTSCVIDEEAIRAFAKSHDLKYFEISARSGDGVEKMFEQICTDLLEFDAIRSVTELPSTTHLTTSQTVKNHTAAKKACCSYL